jgi:hypothetical protein
MGLSFVNVLVLILLKSIIVAIREMGISLSGRLTLRPGIYSHHLRTKIDWIGQGESLSITSRTTSWKYAPL